MSRITLNSKCRLCRSEGQKLFLKGIRCYTKCPIDRKGAVKPGMHGLARAGKASAYSLQLRSKQKMKRYYGVQERQFKNLYLKAKKIKGLVGDNLLSLLERRLDNVVYLSGFAASRSAAKQLVSHRHISVNGRFVAASSYIVKLDDMISYDSKLFETFKDKLRLADKDFKLPSWLTSEKTPSSVKVNRLPAASDLQPTSDINLIIEYYSR